MGRGLDSLFLENELPRDNAVSTLRISQIEPNPEQPRQIFDTAALEQLADSVAAHGVLQPIAVRAAKNNGFYEIVAGERRWRAAKMAGLTEIPAVVLSMDDKTAAQAALIENIQREDLNPLEEAQAYRALLQKYGMTQEALSAQLGKNRSSVANTLRLLDLPEEAAQLVNSGALSAGHAKAILSVKDREKQVLLAQQIVKKDLSVRAAEAEAKRLNTPKQTPAASQDDLQTKAYYKTLQDKISTTLGSRAKIVRRKGEAGTLELSFADGKALEALLTRLCGTDFFNET